MIAALSTVGGGKHSGADDSFVMQYKERRPHIHGQLEFLCANVNFASLENFLLHLNAGIF